jgi:hypothetical protein
LTPLKLIYIYYITDGYWDYPHYSLRVIPSANINGSLVEDGFEQIEEIPGKNDIDTTLDGRQERDTSSTW